MDMLKAAGIAIGGLVIGVFVVLLGIVAVFLFAIFGALIGAITGWIISQTPILGDAVSKGFTSIFEVESPDLIAIGAMLGFIAGFFKQWEHKEWKDKDCDNEKIKEWCKDIPDVHIDIKSKKTKSKE